MIQLAPELAATGMTNYTGEALPVTKLVDITDELSVKDMYVRVVYTTEGDRTVAILEIIKSNNARLNWTSQIRAAVFVDELRDMAHSAILDQLATLANILGIQKAKLASIIENGAP